MAYKDKENQRKYSSWYNKKYRNSGKGKIADKKYRLTEKGRLRERIHKAKRKRNLQWIQMFENPFSENVEIDYHHITDVYVVAIPRDLHQLYTGYKHHREMCMDIVKQIYLKGD